MREVQMKRVPHRQLVVRPPRRCSQLLWPDFTGQRPNIRQQLYLHGAEGLPHHRQAQRARRQHDAGLPRQIGAGGADQRRRSARNRLGRPQPRGRGARSRPRRAWFGPFNSTANTVEWRAADGKPFAIIQRWHIADNNDPDKSGRPDRKADAGGDPAAARPGLPCRLYRRARPTPMPTNSPARPPTNSRAISNAARTK